MTWLGWLLGAAVAGPWSLQRVEIISDDPGLWINHDLPGLARRPAPGLLRLAEQVQPTLDTPWTLGEGHLRLGLSLASCAMTWERALGESWESSVGVQTALGLPRGMVGGLAWRRGAWRVGGGLSVIAAASWARPDYGTWVALPTLSVAWVKEESP